MNEIWRACQVQAEHCAETFCWLAGQHPHYQVTGGQSWTLPAQRNALLERPSRLLRLSGSFLRDAEVVEDSRELGA